ncbi:hypothetical protein KCP70_19245 [Salmonella enterica subsp. enterica]|nr:hypothetical protein KCP70_19245 [Salmonella enterica subsp. enterica]
MASVTFPVNQPVAKGKSYLYSCVIDCWRRVSARSSVLILINDFHLRRGCGRRNLINFMPPRAGWSCRVRRVFRG